MRKQHLQDSVPSKEIQARNKERQLSVWNDASSVVLIMFYKFVLQSWAGISERDSSFLLYE